MRACVLESGELSAGLVGLVEACSDSDVLDCQE
jgi:hypothetical protein